MKPSLLLLLPLALAGGACGGGARSPEPGAALPRYARPPNVLLVTIDTLRADHLGCYGYFRDTAPHLDALAAEGILYERAMSTSGSTLPSHLSLFTGLYPHQHGHTSNKGAMKGPFQPGAGREPVSLYFERAGYRTAAFISGNTLKRTTGAHHGFETWDQPEGLNRRGQATRERAVAWLRENATDGATPFFLWVHFWDVHEPNDPPEPWRSSFHADQAVESLIAERRVDAARLQARFSPLEIARLFYPDLVEPLRAGQAVEVPPLDHQKLLGLIDVYDGSILYVDEQVGALLDCLRELGAWERTVVAVAGDHGQALGQRDWLEHGEIRTEEVHVPMILRLAPGLGQTVQRVGDVVSTVDLMPTILARIEGEAFRTFERQASGSDLLSGETHRGWAFSHRTDRERSWEKELKYGVTMGRWRYYHEPDGQGELYDLRADPGEWTDLAQSHPEERAKLERLVQGVLSTKPADGTEHGTLSEEERLQLERELKASGYMGEDEEVEH